MAERTRSRPLPGTQHFINPKRIPADEDFVALSGFGSLVRWLAVAAAIASMFLAVYLIFDGASGIGSGTVHRLFDLATNPVIGLLIGIVATATIQSSTTVTALTVAAVGTGSLQVAVALPIILGANVGTTLTSLIVSLIPWAAGPVSSGRSRRRRCTRRSTSSSSSSPSGWRCSSTRFGGWRSWCPPRCSATVPPTPPPVTSSSRRSPRSSTRWASAAGWGALGPPRRVRRRHRPGRAGHRRRRAGDQPPAGRPHRRDHPHPAGTVLRGLRRPRPALRCAHHHGRVRVLGDRVLPAPLAATKSLRYREVLPIILGANVGTTLTALLTALAVPGSMGSIAVQAALIHVAFNVISALLVLLIPPLRTLILWMGQVSGRVAARGYTLAAAVLAASYLVLPLAVILGYTLVT
ncbi:hypothetical protein QP028_09425 [Corynebacterium suedekumii]|nr:hypothetical protein QP028_09425 [Corynebacterium suedekumii]